MIKIRVGTQIKIYDTNWNASKQVLQEMSLNNIQR